MSIEEQKKIHEEIYRLWEQCMDLRRQIFALQESVGELDQASQMTAKKLYDLYLKSDAGLNGEKINIG